jgi:hypothetical protein
VHPAFSLEALGDSAEVAMLAAAAEEPLRSGGGGNEQAECCRDPAPDLAEIRCDERRHDGSDYRCGHSQLLVEAQVLPGEFLEAVYRQARGAGREACGDGV